VGAAPFGAGDACRDYPCYRASAPTARRVLRNTTFLLPSFRTYGAAGSAQHAFLYRFFIFYRYFAPHGAAGCPVWGKISVENVILFVGAAPFGAGDACCDYPFYRAFAPTVRRVLRNTNTQCSTDISHLRCGGFYATRIFLNNR